MNLNVFFFVPFQNYFDNVKLSLKKNQWICLCVGEEKSFLQTPPQFEIGNFFEVDI